MQFGVPYWRCLVCSVQSAVSVYAHFGSIRPIGLNLPLEERVSREVCTTRQCTAAQAECLNLSQCRNCRQQADLSASRPIDRATRCDNSAGWDTHWHRHSESNAEQRTHLARAHFILCLCLSCVCGLSPLAFYLFALCFLIFTSHSFLAEVPKSP